MIASGGRERLGVGGLSKKEKGFIDIDNSAVIAGRQGV